jgi:hypothetical protein
MSGKAPLREAGLGGKSLAEARRRASLERAAGERALRAAFAQARTGNRTATEWLTKASAEHPVGARPPVVCLNLRCDMKSLGQIDGFPESG